jgi:hypothetical protein
MVRVRCVVTVLLLAALPLAVYANESSVPPKNLRLVGDHWTPYNPPDPASFPAGAKVHIIVPGDTLWALAAHYYGDPYLWPQLWEQNTYITDAHWIYPGDPLLIQGETDTGELGEEFEMTPTDSGTGEMVSGPAGDEVSPVALGKESDIYCFGYLATEQENLPNRINAFEDLETKYIFRAVEQSIGLGPGDIVFIEGGTSTGLVAGETYLIVETGNEIYHPVTGDFVGWHHDFRGQLRILCAGETESTAVIVQACKDVHVGDRLKPIPEIPIPIVRRTAMADVCTPASGKVNGHIVHAKDFKYALGEGTVVEIDLGRDHMIQPGDFLTVFRDNPTGGPRTVLGEIGVLTAEAKTATAMIVGMRYSMQVGDRVEVK